MRSRTACFCASVLLVICCGVLAGADSADPAAATSPAPEDVLRTRGLTRASAMYLVEGDAKLAEGLRAVRSAKKQEDDYKARRAAIEKQLKTARATVSQWSAEYVRVNEKMAATGKGDARKYNVLVGQSNALQNRIKESEHLIAGKEKELEALVDPRGRYLAAVVDLAEKMEAAAKQYEALGADAQVKAALAKLNEKPGVRFRLGPSPAFAEELPKVRKLREQIITAPVKLTFEGGTPHVAVTLNGKVTRQMTVDSGAAAVVISWQTAEECGMTPGPGDPTVTAVLADGKKVESKQMVLESVQVGPFIVRNVECLVLPRPVKDSGGGLLGGTFLRHFVYQSDLAAGELHMTQRTESKTVATTRPAAAPTTQGAVAAGESGDASDNGFTVPSSGTWTEVGFTVEVGKCYEVKARGKWAGSEGGETGPAGLCPPDLFHLLGPQPHQQELKKQYYFGHHPRGALVGRIGSEQWTFYVGASCRFLSPVSGALSLKMNDTASASDERRGALKVTVEPVAAQWVDRNGRAEILARIDAEDRLHLTPDGPYWEWGGQWGKVGQHEGHWPTVINGTYWWPRWAPDGKKTDPLIAPELWPKNAARFQVAEVKARRGKVEVLERGTAEIVLRFSDGGLGSSQVGCVVETGNR